MDTNKDSVDWGQQLLCFAGMGCLVLFLFLVALSDTMYSSARRALITQAPVDTSFCGMHIHADFNRSTYVNWSTATCALWSSTKQDYNKSHIIGHWIGNRSKQAGKGLIEGVFSKGKYDE